MVETGLKLKARKLQHCQFFECPGFVDPYNVVIFIFDFAHFYLFWPNNPGSNYDHQRSPKYADAPSWSWS